MEPTKKDKNWFTNLCLEIFQWMEKNRIKSVLGASLIWPTVIFLILCLAYKIYPPENGENFSKWIFEILENYSTIILFISSLLTAFVLWLFRNHDIVMNLNLDMYQEAVRNIHNHNNEKAKASLRLVAFKTLMELKEKNTWKEKIRKDVFPGANLRGLDLDDTDLSETVMYQANLINVDLRNTDLTRANLWKATLTEANLTKANLTGANLTGANLTGAILTGTILTETNLTGAYYYKNDIRTPVTKKWLREVKGAENVDTVEGILEDLNLTEVNLQGVDLKDFYLYGTYYYKNEEARQKGIITPVTKKWLRERGAKNVDTVIGIYEE